jgi:uncharacterized membrane protein
MTEELLLILEKAAHVISLVGVFAIVAGFLAAAVKYAVGFRRLGPEPAFARFKVALGRALLLGLEILVVADVIETITVEQTFESLSVLGLLVLLRTFVSWTLTLEIEGRWPWQPAVEA